MKIYVYIDESGSIHKNSNTRYFAVGGFFVMQKDKAKVRSIYKRINKQIKENHGYSLDKEVKSFDMTQSEKIEVFNKIQDIDSFYGVAKVFDKNLMHKEIIQSNVFFNYAVKILLKDCILPLLNLAQNDEEIEFILSVDNRNVGVDNLKDLQSYLNTEFCMSDMSFQVTYYDSSTNFLIQLADLVVNTFYNKYKDIRIVDKVVLTLKEKNFRTSIFPSRQIKRW